MSTFSNLMVVVVVPKVRMRVKRWQPDQSSSVGSLHEAEESLVLVLNSARGQEVSVRVRQNGLLHLQLFSSLLFE